MSVIAWFRGLRENIQQKNSAKLEIRQYASSTAGKAVQAWVAPPVAVPTAPTSSLSEPGSIAPSFAAGARASAVSAPPTSDGHPNAASALPHLMPQFDLSEPAVRYMADVPPELKERIQQEAISRAFRRLETPLRALNMATSKKRVNYPPEEMRGFLLMWRQALSDYIGLVPDERTVLVYERSVDEAYFVRGRATIGAHLTVIEPCWKLNGEVVVRGEAQVIQGWVR